MFVENRQEASEVAADPSLESTVEGPLGELESAPRNQAEQRCPLCEGMEEVFDVKNQRTCGEFGRGALLCGLHSKAKEGDSGGVTAGVGEKPGLVDSKETLLIRTQSSITLSLCCKDVYGALGFLAKTKTAQSSMTSSPHEMSSVNI